MQRDARGQGPLDDPELLGSLVDAFLHDVDEGMVLIDLETETYLEVNDAYCRMSGQRREDVVGRSTTDARPLVEPHDRDRIGRRLAAGEEGFREDLWLRRTDGSVFLAEVTTRTLAVGPRRAVFMTLIDVMARRRGEEGLRSSHDQLAAVVSAVDEVVLEFDDRGVCVDVWTGNPSLVGRSAEELRGSAATETFGAAVGASIGTAVAQVLADGERRTIEFPLDVAGTTRRFLARVSRIAGLEGRDATAVLYLRDVSGRHGAEDALRRSEASARMLFAANPLPMWVWDPDTYGFLDVNEAAVREYGYSREEFLSMRALDIRPTDEQERLRTDVTQDDEIKHYGLWRHRRKDGSELTAEIWSTLIPWNAGEARLSISLNVTDRVRAERALTEAEARYRSLVETIPAAVYLDRIDELFSNAYISPQIATMIGYTPEDFERDPVLWRSILHPEDRDGVVAWGADAASAKEPYDDEYRVIAKDGRVVWVRDLGIPIADASGKPTYWQGFLTDVTERKEAERRLGEAEQRAQLILDHISDLVALVGLDGTVMYASPSHEDVLGIPARELVGELAWARVPSERRALSQASFARAVDGEATPAIRYRLLDADGNPHEMEGAGWQPIRDEDGAVSAILAVSRDVTERERVERERRAMLSRLVVAGEEERRRIADDIHDAPIQSLTALGIRLETLRAKVDDDGLELLDRIIRSVGDSIGSLRSLMFDLRPPVLDREGLVPALRDLLAGISEEGAAVATYALTDRTTRQPGSETRIVLYRIVQEALVNVRKHAAAAHVDVIVESVDGGTRVRVEDDGSGLPRDAWATRRGHVGLSAMRERAGSVGGTFGIWERESGGTVVEAWVPEPALR